MLDDTGSGNINSPDVQTLFNALLDVESAKIDGMISSIYEVPLIPAPPLLRNACIVFVCYSLYRRRLTPDERNPFKTENDALYAKLKEIGEGTSELDLNFKREFSQGSVLQCPIVVNSTMI